MLDNLGELVASAIKATDAAVGLLTKPIKEGLDVIAGNDG